ncbi:MAG TPA: hypothetical protein DCG38_05930 [Eubacteriaceae bacterium]|jgi:threonine-phosphate decarboxylase|nr:hypothetical protein [Eubacteriaceae bacterium]
MLMNSFRHGGDVWQGKDPGDWIDFSANLNPEGTPEKMMDEIKNSIEEIGFYPDQNMWEAKKNISVFLRCDMLNVLPANGGIGALQLIVECERPQKAIIIEPSFLEYKRLSINAGAEIIRIPMLKNDSIIWDVNRIKKEMTCDSMIFICSPSNPLGNLVERKLLADLIEHSEKIGGKILLDEAFIDYCDERCSARDLIGRFDSLIIIGSFTKMFAIPGVRLGYVLASKESIDKYQKHMMPWMLSAQAVGASRALPGLRDFAEQSRIKNNHLREDLASKLSKLGFKVFDSEGSYLLVKIKDDNIQLDIIEKRLKEYKILIRNCSNYECLGERYFRVGVKSDRENRILIESLKKVLSDLNKEGK